MVVARVEPLAGAPAPDDSARVRLLRWARDGVGGVELIGGDARHKRVGGIDDPVGQIEPVRYGGFRLFRRKGGQRPKRTWPDRIAMPMPIPPSGQTRILRG